MPATTSMMSFPSRRPAGVTLLPDRSGTARPHVRALRRRAARRLRRSSHTARLSQQPPRGSSGPPAHRTAGTTRHRLNSRIDSPPPDLPSYPSSMHPLVLHSTPRTPTRFTSSQRPAFRLIFVLENAAVALSATAKHSAIAVTRDPRGDRARQRVCNREVHCKRSRATFDRGAGGDAGDNLDDELSEQKTSRRHPPPGSFRNRSAARASTAAPSGKASSSILNAGWCSPCTQPFAALPTPSRKYTHGLTLV